jgi:hypothetical protein
MKKIKKIKKTQTKKTGPLHAEFLASLDVDGVFLFF